MTTFPNNPNTGDQVVFNKATFEWNGSRWVGVSQETGIQKINIWAKQNLLIPNRKFGLNSGYNGATDQRRTKAGTIPALKHYMERGLGAFGSLLWTPAQITTTLWLDAADASTITESGGAVSQWTDKSGNGNNATQSTPSRQPTFSVDKLEFDGANTTMVLPTDLADLNSVSLFIVGKYDGSMGAANYLVFASGSGSDQRFYCGSADSGFTVFEWRVETLTPIANPTADTNQHIFELVHSSNTATGYLDGTSVGSATKTSTATITNWILGGTNATTNRLDGYLNEIILLNQGASDSDRQLMEGYLAHKWGLTANLPVGHPYKTTAPLA